MYDITNTSLGQDAGGVWSKRVGRNIRSRKTMLIQKRDDFCIKGINPHKLCAKKEDKYNIR